MNRNVLIIDDEKPLAELIEAYIPTEWDTTLVHDVESAIKELSPEYDLYFIDRRLSGGDGREILQELDNRGYNCCKFVVSAIEPDLDLLELSFTDYIVKPVEMDDIREMVSRCEQLLAAGEPTRQYYECRAKQALLAGSVPVTTRESSSEYDELKEELQACRAVDGVDVELVNGYFDE